MRMQTPQTSTSLKVTLQALPDGVAGVKVTLALMVKLARQGKETYVVRRLAEQIISDVKPKAWIDQVRAVHEYVRDHIRYVRDIRGTETVATPQMTIERGIGDCDDKSLLTASLLESLGHPTRFVAVGNRPGDFCHVLVETKIGGNWMAVETTENVALGWYPSGLGYRLVYHV